MESELLNSLLSLKSQSNLFLKCNNWYLDTWSDKAFKGTVVNRSLPRSLHGRTLEITLTVPLKIGKNTHIKDQDFSQIIKGFLSYDWTYKKKNRIYFSVETNSLWSNHLAEARRLSLANFERAVFKKGERLCKEWEWWGGGVKSKIEKKAGGWPEFQNNSKF